MRKIAKTAPILTLIAIMMMSTLSVSAIDYETSISAGNGAFEDGVIRDRMPAVSTIEVDQANSKVTIGEKEFKLERMPDGKSPAESKYFMKGVKLAGYDNDNPGDIQLDAIYKDKDLTHKESVKK